MRLSSSDTVSYPRRRPAASAGKRFVYAVIVVCLAVIGIVGIILPIIPGIIFLALAAWFATRVSRRASRYFDSQPWFRSHARPLDAATYLSIADRLRLIALMTARATVAGMQSLLRQLRKLRR